jgi:lipid-A-disaccharide synthase
MRDPTRSGNIKIGIVAGEASGDALAAMLIDAVRARIPNARFVGIAGPKMLTAGCEAWHPLEALSVCRSTRRPGRRARTGSAGNAAPSSRRSGADVHRRRRA